MRGFADLLLIFPGAASTNQSLHARPGLTWQESAATDDWRLLCASGPSSVNDLHTHSEGSEWLVWCLGEITGYRDRTKGTVECLADFTSDLQNGAARPEKLNGHFLLCGWNKAERQWHFWTDRFGTLHAYQAKDHTRSAIGTFSPAVAQAASQRHLDWRGLAGFFAFGFFPQDRTYFEDVKILRPASHYIFDKQGQLLRESRYWQWSHEPNARRSYADTVAEFADIFGRVIDEQTYPGRVAMPISGGLDSRSTIAALNGHGHTPSVEDRLWSYSYGYTANSVETNIARRIAAAQTLPFQSFIIQPYLFDKMDLVLASVEGFQDVTQCRQAAVVDEISQQADYLIAAHWGDVWLDDMGLADDAQPARGPEQIARHALHRITKGGRRWLLEQLCRPHLKGDLDNCLPTMVDEELGRVAHIADPDFRIKAFKTDQWSFRWTMSSLRMYQAAAFPRLPFFDTRLTDFFCTVPTKYVAKRQLQIDYLKRFAPALARITWQAYDTNLFWQRHFNSWLLPKRAFKKVGRLVARRQQPERNWEVQFLSESGRRELARWLLDSKLKLHEFVPAREVQTLLENFYAAPFEQKRGYTVSMLLTFSAWLERYG